MNFRETWLFEELAHTLIEAATAETFDYSGYRDTHHERLEQLIEAKLGPTASPMVENDSPRSVPWPSRSPAAIGTAFISSA